MPLGDLECTALQTCDYYVWWGTRYLVLAHYSGPAITVGFFVASILLRDVYLLFFGFGLTADTFVNGAVKWLIRDAVPQPTCGSNSNWCSVDGQPLCTYTSILEWFWPFEVGPPDPAEYGVCVPCGMPNKEVQHAAFLATGMLLYATQWHAPRFRGWHRAAFLFWLGIVGYVHAYFGYATAAQVLLGGVVGSVDAFAWQIFVYAAAFPYFDDILKWRIFTWVGSYNNQLTAPVPLTQPMAPGVFSPF